MNRVRAFFAEEAAECLNALAAELADPDPDPAAVHGAVRQLRGSAQVARFGAVADAARSLEEALKPAARGEAPWDEGLARRAAEDAATLARAVEAVREGRMEQDERESSMDEQARNEAAADEVVPIEMLEYEGTAALERARTLREPLEEAIIAGDPPGEIMDELFDLIRLGTK